MIEQAKDLTDDQANQLGTLWTVEEGLTYDKADWETVFEGRLAGYVREIPHWSHPELQIAWNRISDIATHAGRADELDAAIAAEKGVEHREWHLNVHPIPKAGAIEAARSAVLAVGIRDIITDADYQLLVGPWQAVFGTLQDVPHVQ